MRVHISFHEWFVILLILAFMSIVSFQRLKDPVMDIDQIGFLLTANDTYSGLFHHNILKETNPGAAFILYKSWISLTGLDHPQSFHRNTNFIVNPIVRIRLLPMFAFMTIYLLMTLCAWQLTRDKIFSLFLGCVTFLSPLLFLLGWQIRTHIFEALGTAFLFFSLVWILKGRSSFAKSTLLILTIFFFSFFRYFYAFIVVPSFIFVLFYHWRLEKSLKTHIWKLLLPFLLALSLLIPLVFLQKQVHQPLIWNLNDYLGLMDIHHIWSYFQDEFQSISGGIFLFDIFGSLGFLWFQRNIPEKSVSGGLYFLIVVFLLELIASFLNLYPFSFEKRHSVSLNVLIYFQMIVLCSCVIRRLPHQRILRLGVTGFVLIMFSLWGWFGFQVSKDSYGNCLDRMFMPSKETNNILYITVEQKYVHYGLLKNADNNEPSWWVRPYHFYLDNGYITDKYRFLSEAEMTSTLDITKVDFIMADIVEHNAHDPRKVISKWLEEKNVKWSDISDEESCVLFKKAF